MILSTQIIYDSKTVRWEAVEDYCDREEKSKSNRSDTVYEDNLLSPSC